LLLHKFHPKVLECEFYEYGQFLSVSQIAELTQRKFCDGTEIQLVVGIVAQPKFQQLNAQSAQSTLVVLEDLWQMLVPVQNLDQTHHQIEMEPGRACWAWLIEAPLVV
jgi:hypothetical protein